MLVGTSEYINFLIKDILLSRTLEDNLDINNYVGKYFNRVVLRIVEGVCGVCAVDGWSTASPGLSQTDWTLAGWGCTPVVHESNHGTQDKPAINTHTRGGATGMTVVPSAQRIPPA